MKNPSSQGHQFRDPRDGLPDAPALQAGPELPREQTTAERLRDALSEDGK